MIRRLILREQLFTWMTAAHPNELLPKTTSPLEGGVNAGIKDLLRRHRGMSPDHAMVAIGWYLNTKTEHPHNPWACVSPAHWAPSQQRLNRLQRNPWAPSSMTPASAGKTATASNTAGAADHADHDTPKKAHVLSFKP